MKNKFIAVTVAVFSALSLNGQATHAQENSLDEVQVASGEGISLASYENVVNRLAAVEQQLGGGYDVGYECGCCSGGWYAMYDNVIVKPFFSRNIAFSCDDPSITGSNDDRVEESFDWDLEYSPRIEVGRMGDCGGLGWRARYWHFDSDTSVLGTDVEAEVVVADDPDIDIIAADNILATHELNLDVIDLELMGRSCNWVYSGGLRYVRMDQEYLALIDEEAEDDTFNGLRPELFFGHDFEGLGPTFAAEYRPDWCVGGFKFFGIGRASVLFGESSLRADDVDDAGGETLLNVNDADILPIVETQLGVERSTCWGNGVLSLRAAVEAQYWISGGSADAGRVLSDAENDDTVSDFDPQAQDMGFLGATISISYER